MPFDYSMHNYLLRYYVAEHGLDPDQDIQIRAVPPPEMVANLRADNIDGFLAPDPVNQRAVYDGVGFIHVLSKDIWDRHPCCAFAASREFVTTMPNTYAALLKAIIDATAFAAKPENRKQIAAAIAPANYLNQPVTVVEQVLTGTFADGLGNVRTVPDRIDFDPFPWQSFAVWILTQMKRWGQIKGEVDYAGVAQQVFLATDTARLMKEVGLTPPAATSKTFVGDGQGVRPRQARGLHQELRHQARGLSGEPTRRHQQMWLSLRAGLVSLLILGAFIGIWHIAHRRHGHRGQDGPRVRQADGGHGHAGQVGDAGAGRRRRQDLAAPARPVLRQGHQRQGHRHPARLLDRARAGRLSAGGGGGDPDRLPDRHVAADEQGARSFHPGARSRSRRSPGCRWRSTPSATPASRRSS